MVDQVSIARGTADKIQSWTIKAQLQTLTPLKHCLITSLTAAPAAMKLLSRNSRPELGRSQSRNRG